MLTHVCDLRDEEMEEFLPWEEAQRRLKMLDDEYVAYARLIFFIPRRSLAFVREGPRKTRKVEISGVFADAHALFPTLIIRASNRINLFYGRRKRGG